MSDPLPDDRLVSGAVLSAEMWFAIEPVASARTFGRNEAPEPGCVALEYRVSPLTDITLEGPVKFLSALTGTLSVSSQREITQRLGQFRRERDGYRIGISLFEAEIDRFLMLMASGLSPRILKLEFDIEVAQWVELGEYWDDVRYPRVEIHEHYIEWSRDLAPTG